MDLGCNLEEALEAGQRHAEPRTVMIMMAPVMTFIDYCI